MADGATEMLAPLPTPVPPQLPLYHLQLAPVPRLPPEILKVVDLPWQIAEGPLIALTGTEVSCTVTVTLLQIVLLQVPSALRKYVVVAAGATVTLLPVPTDVPPQLPLYHLQLAPVPRLPPLTLKVVFLPRQIVVVPLIEVAGTEVS